MSSEINSRPERRHRAVRFGVLATAFSIWGFLVAGHLSDYVATYYFFRWNDGFIKRGLVGTVLHVLSYPLDPISIGLLAATFIVAVGILLFRFIERTLAGAHDSRAATYQFLFATSPAAFQQLGYDLGRFDALGIVLLLLALPLVQASRPARDKLLAVAICVSGLLVHEAFFFLQLPILVGVAMVEGSRDGRRGLWVPIVIALTAMATLALLLSLGNSDDAATSVTELAVAQGYDPGLARKASDVLRRMVDTDYVLSWLTGRKNQLFFAMSFSAFLVYAALYLRRARFLLTGAESRGDQRWAAVALILSPFGFLALYGVGIDLHRWAACGIFNVLLVGVIMEGRYGDGTSRGWLAMAPRRRVAVAVGASALVGPVGVWYAFPFIVSLLVKLKLASPMFAELLRAMFGDRQFHQIQ